MTIIAASPCRNARLSRQSLMGHDEARSDTQFKPQLDQPASFQIARLDRNKPLIQCNDFEPYAGSSRYLANTSSAALKSP
jgi:hypothetical protein